MKKFTIIFTLLFISGMSVAQPTYTCDPNDIVVDANSVTFTVQITVPKEQYRAMEYLEITLFDMFRRSTFGRLWDRILSQARAKVTENMDLDDLRSKVEG